VSEAVADTGVIVPPRDPEAMAQACLRLLRDDVTRHRLGHAARERALEYFTVDHAVGTFRTIYDDLVRERFPRAATTPTTTRSA
jgi:glycosyltransferase involved in cell wall biosynthesis